MVINKNNDPKTIKRKPVFNIAMYTLQYINSINLQI